MKQLKLKVILWIGSEKCTSVLEVCRRRSPVSTSSANGYVFKTRRLANKSQLSLAVNCRFQRSETVQCSDSYISEVLRVPIRTPEGRLTSLLYATAKMQ
jgi:ribosomal protein L23